MTDLPFGRGVSPLQNHIVMEIYKTKIFAIRAVKDFDAGPLYLKKPFDLENGLAEDLYTKASDIAANMIKEIITRHTKPHPQKGKVVSKKKKPEQSLIPVGLTARALYDFIRMLDAEGYPFYIWKI